MVLKNWFKIPAKTFNSHYKGPVCLLSCCKCLVGWIPSVTSSVQQRNALSSCLHPAALRDQTGFTYLAGNSHSVHMASFSPAEPLWPPACLETRQPPKSRLPLRTLTHTSLPFLFLNQMCFYWVQFGFPRHCKYALGCSEFKLPVWWGGRFLAHRLTEHSLEEFVAHTLCLLIFGLNKMYLQPHWSYYIFLYVLWASLRKICFLKLTCP